MNLYTYCKCNPINYADEFDNWSSCVTKICIGLAGIAVCVIVAVATVGTGADCVGMSMLVEAAKGAIGGAVSGALNPKFCFVAETLVMTKQGLKAIEEMQKGDLVLSYNDNLGIYEYKDVVDVYVNEATELCHIKTAGDEVVSTPNHSILTEKGWMLAKDIMAGDNIQTTDGFVEVLSVEKEELKDETKVYNFNVLGYHTYVIGSDLLVVQSDCANIKEGATQKVEYNCNGKRTAAYNKGDVEVFMNC